MWNRATISRYLTVEQIAEKELDEECSQLSHALHLTQFNVYALSM
jgi:hypothetical protein